MIAALISLGAILLLTLFENTYLLYLSYILLRFSALGLVPLWLTIASEAVPSENSGWATAIAMALQFIGGLIGPPLFGFIIKMRQGFDSAFVFLLITNLITVISIRFLKRLSKEETKTN